jgi:hypothetical protein
MAHQQLDAGRSQCDPEAITAVIASCLPEALPKRQFAVRQSGTLISIDRVAPGSSMSFSPAMALDLSPELRAEYLVAQAKAIQRFLGSARGKPWPTPFAKAHVEITETQIFVWWGGPTYDQAVERLRPIELDELGRSRVA